MRSSPLRLGIVGALALVSATAQQGLPAAADQALQGHLAALSSPLPTARQAALRALERAGAAALPSLLARLESLLAEAPRATEHGRPLFVPARDGGFHRELLAMAEYWPEPIIADEFDLLPAKELRAQRAEWLTGHALGDEVQDHAVRILYLMTAHGEQAAAAVPLLVGLLAHADLGGDAALVLVAIGAPAVPPLLTALGDRKRAFAAAQTLAVLQRGRPPALVRDAVRAVLQDGRRNQRDGALATLARIGDLCGPAEAAAVAKIAEQSTGLTRRLAASALGGMGRAGADELRTLLRGDLDAGRAVTLVGAVLRLGEGARELCPEVLAICERGDAVMAALTALAQAAPGTMHEGRAFDRVLDVARDGALIERAVAIHALGAFERQAARSVPVLVAICENEGYLLQRLGIETLRRLGPAAAAAAPVLRTIAAGDQPIVDAMTARTLSDLVMDDDGDLEGGPEGYRRFDAALRGEAVWTLGAIDPGSVPTLLAWLGDEQRAMWAEAGLRAAGPAAIAGLESLLGNEQRGPRAAWTLAQCGPKGIDVLLQRLDDADATAAANAASGLTVAPAEVSVRLLALLREGKESVRDAVASILAQRDLSELRRQHADALIAAVQDAPPSRRAQLVRAIETVDNDRVTALLVRLVADELPDVRADALSALTAYHDLTRADVERAVRVALGDPLPSVRIAAARAAGSGRGVDAGTVERLRAMATALNVEERTMALEALGAFRDAAAGSLPVLATALDDRSAAIRAAGLRGCGGLGVLAQSHQDRIVALVRDAEAATRDAALDALAAVRPDRAAAVQRVREHLAVDEWNSAIGTFGGRTRPKAMPPDFAARLAATDVATLRAALADVRQWPAESKSLLPAIVSLLGHGEVEVRIASIDALAAIDAAAAVQHVRPLVDDPAPPVRIAVLGVFGKQTGDGAVAVFGDVVTAVDDREASVRLAALAAGGKLVQRDRSLQAGLEQAARKALADPEAAVRAAAAIACTACTVLEPATVALLLPRLQDDDVAVRRAAAAALGGGGDAAKPAVPSLLAMAQSTDAADAGPALRALAALAPDQPAVLWAALTWLQDAAAAAGPAGSAALSVFRRR